MTEKDKILHRISETIIQFLYLKKALIPMFFYSMFLSSKSFNNDITCPVDVECIIKIVHEKQ